MPRYDYKCDAVKPSCDYTTEITHNFDYELTLEEKLCPCGDGYLVKKFTATPVTFKGNGFYKTDNA